MRLDQKTLLKIENRIGRDHLAKRLRGQVKHSAIQFDEGGFQFHWEYFEPSFAILRQILRFLGLLNRGMSNAMDYRLEETTVHFRTLPKTFQGFKILQLSDMHVDGVLDKGERLRKKISHVDFDLCVITGDFRFFTFHDYERAMAAMKRLVDSLSCEHGIIGILGNHDFIEMAPILEAMGIRLLLNEALPIKRSDEVIWVAGVDDPHFYRVHDLAKAFKGVPQEAFKVLLAHSPELLDEAARSGVDYYLCGHTHGGQICLPGTIPILTNANCPRRYVRGSWKYQKMAGHTSRGTGSSGLPVRFFCPPEITLHKLI